jgi:hypothetical protein
MAALPDLDRYGLGLAPLVRQREVTASDARRPVL